MRIALLTNGLYPFDMGGMQKHSYYLARYLAQQKVWVDLYYYRSEQGKKRSAENAFQNEELKYISFHEVDFPSSVYFPGHYIFNSYHYSQKIYQNLLKNLAAFDFIYAQGFTAWDLLRKKRIGHSFPPVGVNFHGLEMFQIAANLRSRLEQYLFRPPARFCLQKSDIAFSLGGKLTSIIEKQTDDTTEIWKIPIGIEKKWLNKETNSTSAKRRFVFIGRYERRKGVPELNKVIKKISKSYEFYFEFIGPIPEKYRLDLQNCIYHGSVYEEDRIIKIVSKGDILVCPSYSEGMPTVILEAMSRGLAVIATDVGAVSELVDSGTGWLIKPAAIYELEKALISSLKISEEGLKRKKEEALRLIGKEFIWDKVISTTLDNINLYI